MGCQSTKCRNCGANYPACQLVNGLCGGCRSIGKFINRCINAFS